MRGAAGKSREHTEALKQKASRRLLKESMAGGFLSPYDKGSGIDFYDRKLYD